METTNFSNVAWRKSKHSATNGSCVELGALAERANLIAVRDSKNPDGSKLAFSRTALRALRAGITTAL